MAQVLVTLDSLRSYARSLDERVRDKNKYPDSWIDSKINAGYELVATKRQPFFKEEVLDLNPYIIDGTDKFEAEMAEDVAGWKQVFATSPRANAIRWVTTPDNKTMIDLDTNSLSPNDENLITFQFYYFPHTKTGDQYMSTDVYHMVRHGIASSVYDALHDYERRDNFDAQLDYNARTMVNALDYDGESVRKSNWIV